MIVSSRTSSSKLISSLNSRSTLRAPTTSSPTRIGTHRNEMLALSTSRLRVRLRNRGSLPMFGTTIGSPLATTGPVMPSPKR